MTDYVQQQPADDDEQQASVTPVHRLAEVIRELVQRLPADERERRIAHCQEHDEHGVRIQRDGNDWRVYWGGAVLTYIPVDILDDPDPDVTVVARYVDAPAPDDLSSLDES